MTNELTPEAAKFLELANEGKNIFLTGLAWSWKSHLIWQFLAQTQKKYQVLAPTGIAAINAWWSTIHRFFKLKQWIDPQFQNIEPSVATAIGKLDWFIIDEISMARVDLMESMDDMLKRITMNRSEPFWWKQIILVWDLFQLPPVVDEEYQKYIAPRFSSPFFFDLPEFDECWINIIALKKVRRQTDDNYLKILNHIRVGNWDQMILNVLNSRISNETPPNTIILAPTNKLVDYYNEKEFYKLVTQEYIYTANIQWSFTKDMYPTEEFIRIKEGCQVMMTANWEWYSNGSIWTFLREDQKSVPGSTWLQDVLIIEIDWEEIDVPKKTRTIDTPIMEDWKLNRKTIGTFIQFPIKLWYCISIHKSQWLTFDSMILDPGNWMFAAWQLYVALSRCKSLWWLYLKKPIKSSDVKTDKYILSWVRSQKW